MYIFARKLTYMGIVKTDMYTDEVKATASYFKVLGHPARIRILIYLSKRDSCVCGDIVQEIGLAQSTISQHLKVLKDAGFIQGSIEGASVCYCINADEWNKCNELIQSFRNQLATNAIKCC